MEKIISNPSKNDHCQQGLAIRGTSPMEKILCNPGLVHLAENILVNLDEENLEICQQITQSLKQMIANPIFWLKKFSALSKENQKAWIKVIQSVKNTYKEKYVISYLKWNLKKEALVDLPCYTSPAVQNEYRKKIKKICEKKELSSEDTEIIKILAPLTDNPNFSNEKGETSVYEAACRGHTEIISILAPFADNPNAPDAHIGYTPIHWAVENGNKEIVKILAPLTDIPNAPDKNGDTPINSAALNGQMEIIQILVPFTENPNSPNKEGCTPIHSAALYGHTEIVKILAPLTNNPNAPTKTKNRDTPLHLAALFGHTDIVKILAPLAEYPNAQNKDGDTPIKFARNEEIRRILKSVINPRKRKGRVTPSSKPSKKKKI